MKRHASTAAVGGLLVPIALALATAIANEAQTLLGLRLNNLALAVYLIPFLAGAAAAMHALLRLEAGRIAKSLGGLLGTAMAPIPVSDQVAELLRQPLAHQVPPLRPGQVPPGPPPAPASPPPPPGP